MNRNLALATAAFLFLSLAAIWNGRRMHDTLGQVDLQIFGANEQRLAMWKLNNGFASPDGRPRIEDSVVAVAERVAPWMALPASPLAGLAIGQASLRNVIWHATTWGAEPALEVLENAQTSAGGHFDLSLILVFVLPLYVLFAPRHDALMLAVGPTVSLIGVLAGGAPLASADTWLRAAVWIVLIAVYGYFWLALRERLSSYLITGVVYLTLVAVLPALAIVVGSLVAPPPSRVVQAEHVQAALRPVMEVNSRNLAPYYETHPEYVEGGHTVADYDRAKLDANARRHAVLGPVLAEVEASAATHRTVVKVLALLSPAAILHLALVETAGTGVSRPEAFVAIANDFGQRWSTQVKAYAATGHPLRPADFDQLPHFTYVEQPLLSWLIPAGVGLVALLFWLAVLMTQRPKAV